jgi:hypothetical protein
MKVLGWLIHTVKKFSGDNFFPRVVIYPNTFIHGQYVYIISDKHDKHITIDIYVTLTLYEGNRSTNWTPLDQLSDWF